MGKVISLRRNVSFASGPKFEAAWQAFPAIGRERSSRKEASVQWGVVSCQIGEDKLLAAVRRYAKDGKDHAYAPGFHRWLAKGRWEHWADLETVMSTVTTGRLFPDEALRESFHVAFMNQEARRWLDACTWSPEEREIVSPQWGLRQEWIDGPFKIWALANQVLGLRFR